VEVKESYLSGSRVAEDTKRERQVSKLVFADLHLRLIVSTVPTSSLILPFHRLSVPVASTCSSLSNNAIMDTVSAHRPVVAHGKPGTAADVDDMKRMNRPQELNVRCLAIQAMPTVISQLTSL
jgi:hypothetical protein